MHRAPRPWPAQRRSPRWTRSSCCRAWTIPPTSRSKGVAHGEALLGLLDEVRDGLLSGGIPRGTLNRLADAVGRRHENFADPRLQGVLDEIELRARVELAKLEQADRLAELTSCLKRKFRDGAGLRIPFAAPCPHLYNPAALWLGAIHSRGVSMGTELPQGYKPTENEPFMNERQREYFRRKLNGWKDEILRESRETIQNLQAETVPHADLADRASTEAERQLELRTRDRQRKLIAKIDSALRRLEDGSYGFCEETGEPISLKRLDARPIATLSIEAQERHERSERVYRDD